MNWLIPPRRFDPATPEFTDRSDADPRLLGDELQTLRKLNGQSDAYRQAIWGVEQLIDPAAPAPARILDVGTGGADVPRAIAAWARQRRIAVEITAVDRNPSILRHAREWSADWPEVRFEEQDALHLPYAAGSFDVVMCGLMLHHFTAEDAVGLLRQMQTLARRGYFVNDLRRNRAVVSLVDLFSAFVRNPATRHDARASARAAFSLAELRALADQAGLAHYQIKRSNGLFRMVLVGRKQN